jgi:hypothetical protein
MKLVFLFRKELPQEEAEKYIPAWRSWTQDLTQKGILKGGLPLTPSGKVVSQNTVESFQLSQDTVTGYAEIEAVSFDEAIEIAKGCPNMQYGGKVEIREPMNMEGMFGK